MNGKQRWVLALTSVASLMVALDALVVSTALGTIRTDLGASIGQLEWTVNAYVLSFAVLMMTASALGDRLGRRRLFAAGLGLFAAASVMCALSPDVNWLIAGRAVQGVGAALVMPLALAQLSAAFPPERMGWATGVFSGVTALSTLAGPLVGGAIAQGLAWQWIFWLNVPIGLVIGTLALRRMPEGFGPRATLDVPGLAMITAGAFGLVWGLVRANSSGWGSIEVLSGLAGGALLAIAFVAWELRAGAPMLPMRLFRSRAFSAGNAAMFLLNGSLFGAVFFMAQFQQTALGQGPFDAGLRLLPWGAAMFLVAPRAGTLADRFGARTAIAGGLLLQALGMAWIALIADPGLAYAQMIAPMVVAGAGFALAIPVVQTSVMVAAPRADIGKASGTLSTIRQLGGVFGIAIPVAVFAAAGGYASAQAFSDGFAAAMGVCAALALAGAIAGALLPGRRETAVVAAVRPAEA
jgi:EmrB/QacA subfamily drug resistance transporter